MTYGLTPTQRFALLVIQELTALDGRAPTYREIAREMSLGSRNGVYCLVQGLIERGYLAQKRAGLVVLHRLSAPEDFDYDVVR